MSFFFTFSETYGNREEKVTLRNHFTEHKMYRFVFKNKLIVWRETVHRSRVRIFSFSFWPMWFHATHTFCSPFFFSMPRTHTAFTHWAPAGHESAFKCSHNQNMSDYAKQFHMLTFVSCIFCCQLRKSDPWNVNTLTVKTPQNKSLTVIWMHLINFLFRVILCENHDLQDNGQKYLHFTINEKALDNTVYLLCTFST